MAKHCSNKDSKNNGKGKGSNNRGRRSSNYKPHNNPKDEQEIKEPKDNDVNDSSFYYLDNTLRDQLCNFSFNSFNGVEQVINPNVVGSTGTAEKKFFNGNIMKIELIPTVTPPLNPLAPTDGINLVALRNYTLLSANNAKTTNYQPQDVTVLMLALKALAETACNITRMFGILYQYNMRNRKWPDKMFQLMYVDADDFRKNAAAYRVRFNTILTAANKIPFFDNYGAFAKAKNMYSDIYMDDVSAMAQTYFFYPKSTWLYVDAYDSNGAGLKTWMDYSVVQTMANILDDFDTMVTNLLTSSSLNYIYSDVLRLFEKGSGNLMRFDLVPDFYKIDFKKSDELEHYINNLHIIGIPATRTTPGDYNDLSCDANTNCISYPLVFKSTYGPAEFYDGLHAQDIVNFRSDSPDVETKIAATRLMSLARFVKVTGGVETSVIACGDYMVVGVKLTEAYSKPYETYNFGSSVVEVTASNYYDIMEGLSILDKFKYGPRITPTNAATAGLDPMGPFGDLTYYTFLDVDFMRRMYDAEMLGEFALRI